MILLRRNKEIEIRLTRKIQCSSRTRAQSNNSDKPSKNEVI